MTPPRHAVLPRAAAWRDRECRPRTVPLRLNPNGELSLHIVKVFDGTSCGWAYSSSLIAAVDQCRAAGTRVINMSLGGSTASETESAAFQSAYNAGFLSNAAPGNSGNTSMSYPAACPSGVSVAALDQAEQLACFSQRNDDVELAAPGVGVLSTVPWGYSNALRVGGLTYGGTYMTNGA